MPIMQLRGFLPRKSQFAYHVSTRKKEAFFVSSPMRILMLTEVWPEKTQVLIEVLNVLYYESINYLE